MRSGWTWRCARLVLAMAVAWLASTGSSPAQTPLRKIGEMELRLLGLSATVDPIHPVIPKNTRAGVAVVVQAGGVAVPAADVFRLLGGAFSIEAQLTGPGLAAALPVAVAVSGPVSDSLILPLDPLPMAGDYTLSQLRLVKDGRPILDLTPSQVTVQVIEQVLVTSVKTRPLTLDEIKQKGIVLDRDDYLGFEFTLGLKLESKVVNVSLPVVFDRQGLVVPEYLEPPDVAVSGVTVPTFVPMMLEFEDPRVAPGGVVTLPSGQTVPLRIPSVLVIPGNVGYLKQMFSAQLFVANGAPLGSGLSVRDVSGTINLPLGDDHVANSADDPLTLATTVKGVQPATMPIRIPGADGTTETGEGRFQPGEQGQAEFLLVGEREGYHAISFDVHATLDGLPTGPAPLKGQATGGVLVRNPYFNVSFTVPAVARRDEPFTLYATVSNIGQGAANNLHVSLDGTRMSGATLLGDATQEILTLAPGDARTLAFQLLSKNTGQVVASYLRFDGAGAGGDVKFTVGVGERGVPLSPDTLVLPAVVDALPGSVIDAAMRVLGQAWSVAQSPSGTLPAGVSRIAPATVQQKAQLLAEAGLRISLGEAVPDAVRDLAFDFHGGSPIDAGFDQLLRTTTAGRDLDVALGAELSGAGSPDDVHLALSQVAASGPDFIAVSATGLPASTVEVRLIDASGRRTVASAVGATPAASDVRSAVFLPLSADAANVLGLVTAPSAAPYTLDLRASGTASGGFAVTLPRGDGTFVRGTIAGLTLDAGPHARVVIDPLAADSLTLELDTNGDDIFETRQLLVLQSIVPQGPSLVSATVVGPETLTSASAFGVTAALLYDRVVDRAAAADPARYSLPSNRVFAAQRQLSGRLVFLTFEQPEGPYVGSTLTAQAVADSRGTLGAIATVPLQSRLADPGAIVTGRVLEADGRAVVGARVLYSNRTCGSAYPITVAATATGPDGGFEYRYVRQDACGRGFTFATQDPGSGATRDVTAHVRTAGERLVLDLVLLGRGTVAGTVRTLMGAPVADATVVALSTVDSQSGGTARTDGDGRFIVYGVTVGGVSVKAVKGAGLGVAFGQIARAGTVATIDVALDTGSSAVSGTVSRVGLTGSLSPIVGAIVAYRVPSGTGFVPVAFQSTDAAGHFAFEAMPAGRYEVQAQASVYEWQTFAGTSAPGDNRTDVHLLFDSRFGSVSGFVRMPDGQPARNAIVALAGRGVLTGSDGSFLLDGIPLVENSRQHLYARTRDGLRTTEVSIELNSAHPAITGLALTLSGLGIAEFTVLDGSGQPVTGQTVQLLMSCGNPCGCVRDQQVTNAEGQVRFEGVPAGTASAAAYRVSGMLVDVARGSATIRADGATGMGVLRFSGAGVVSGIVYDPDGRPAVGVDIELSSNRYDSAWCSLMPGVSHHTQTGPDGRFSLSNVNVGPVSVSATHPFFNTRVGAQGTITHAGEELSFTLHLVNTIAGEVSGTVYLPDGATPAGAGVEVTARGALPDVIVSTNEQGVYRFAKIFPEGSYLVTVRDPVTGGVAQEQVYLKAGQDLAHDVRLKGQGRVRVQVLDGANQPTDALVRLRETAFPNRSFEGVADAANSHVVTFDGVFEGPISVEASDAFGRGGRQSATLPGPAQAIDVNVHLTTTGIVRGHFYLPDHASAVPFARVRLLSAGRVIGEVTTSGVDDVGAFSFDYVPAGDIRVEAQDPATSRSGVATGRLTSEGEIVVLDVVAQAIGSVEGLVTSNGAPQPGAWVEVASSGGFRARSLADGGGRYLVRGVPEGRVTATGSLDGGLLAGTASATLAGEGSTLTLDVALRGSGRVIGHVYQAGGTTAAPPTVVTGRVGGAGGGTFTTMTDENGAFAFDRVPAGLATLDADVVGSTDRGTTTVEVTAGGEVAADIVLIGIGTIHGRALDSTETPIVGDVTVRGTGEAAYSYTVRSDLEGAFNVTQALAGPFTVSLRAKVGDVTLFGTTSGTLAAGGEAAVDVHLQDSGTVTGLVLRADGTTPAVGADVVLQLASAYGQVKTQAQADGRFAAIGLPLGAVSLRVDDPLTGGVGRVAQAVLEQNGQVVDVGTIVLDDTPVTVTSVEPTDGAAGVALDQTITVTFSDPLASTSGIGAWNGTQRIGLSWVLSASGLVATGTGTLPEATEVTVAVSPALTDVYGRHPSQSFSSRFRTVDLSPPHVTSVVPDDYQLQVPVATTIVVTFNEPIADATDLSTLISLTGPGGTVPGTASRTSGNAVTFTPGAPLADNGSYTVTVNGAIDATGNRQTAAFVSHFSTPDTIAPVLALSSPAALWTASRRPTITITGLDALTGIAQSGAVLSLDGGVVPATLSGSILSYTPTTDLDERLHPLTASLADRAGNVGQLTASFGVDATPPTDAAVSGVQANAVVAGTMSVGAIASDGLSGVAQIELLLDGAINATLDAPFERTLDTRTISEGRHTLSARAIDAAGNRGAAGPSVPFIVDNHPVTLTIISPAAGTVFRESVTVRASVSEPVDRVEFVLGTTVIADTAAPYEATFDLATTADGTTPVQATAFGLAGEQVGKSVSIVVDRTPPAAPDPALISAEPPQSGLSLVYGLARAVEGGARVEAVHTTSGTTATATAAADGSFRLSIVAAVDDLLSLTATDAVGNRSAATVIAVRQTPSLPPAEGSTTLHFEGVLVDRIGSGTGALTPDGLLDGIFTVSVAIGDGLTRQLSFIDLAGATTVTTRTGQGTTLGVAVDAGAPFLNAPDGTVSLPVTSGATLTLFTPGAGFVADGRTYTVTVGFTDGSRFVATCTIVAPADRAQVARSVVMTASPASVSVPAGGAGTTAITVSDIRDIDGARVPDGAKIALSATNLASKAPGGAGMPSAGGSILDGDPAPNNPDFKVFTVVGGTVTATYSSYPVTPTAYTGAVAVVQVQAADAVGDVLGTDAIGSLDINLRLATDSALVLPVPSSLYSDRADRRSQVTILVPAPDGTKVAVTAGSSRTTNPNSQWIASAGGEILGGDPSPSAGFRAFTVLNGRIDCEYQAPASASLFRSTRTAMVQVVAADASGAVTSNRAIGTGAIALTGGGSVTIRFSADSLPLVFPSMTARVLVSQPRDARANRLPDASQLQLTASWSTTTTPAGSWWPSAGGAIVDGVTASDSRFRSFPLQLGEVSATYSPGTLTAEPGDVRTAMVQVVAGDSGLSTIDNHALQASPIKLLGPSNAVGTATPSSIPADGALHATTIDFHPILDAWGNPLPDGSAVLVTAAPSSATGPGGGWVATVGGQILNGSDTPAGSNYRLFTVEDGGVRVTYGNQGLTAAPGATRVARVSLLEAGPSGDLVSYTALGSVPVELSGMTSATATASPTALHADGSDRRAVVTISNVRDAAGNPLPDGTLVGVTAGSSQTTSASGSWVPSAGGDIVGGTPVAGAPQIKAFPLQNGQVVVEYSAAGLTVASGERTATVQLVGVTPQYALISNRAIGTASIELVAPASALVAANPPDLLADLGAHVSQITVSQLTDSGGLPIPDGAKVALTATPSTAALPGGSWMGSAGGSIASAGTTPGDGDAAPNDARFRVFTVAGGQVQAVYSAAGLSAGVDETRVARVGVVPASSSGNTLTNVTIGVGAINLHGTTSAAAAGPATLHSGGESAAVTFASIKDSGGNLVPDGTLVAVTATSSTTTWANGSWVGSTGGTIADGTPASDARFRLFPVVNGSVTVTYSTSGAGIGTARVQVIPARSDGTLIGIRTLDGGVWAITVTQ